MRANRRVASSAWCGSGAKHKRTCANKANRGSRTTRIIPLPYLYVCLHTNWGYVCGICVRTIEHILPYTIYTLDRKRTHISGFGLLGACASTQNHFKCVRRARAHATIWPISRGFGGRDGCSKQLINHKVSRTALVHMSRAQGSFSRSRCQGNSVAACEQKPEGGGVGFGGSILDDPVQAHKRRL